MWRKLTLLILVCVVVSVVISVEPSKAQINYDEYNYWWAQRVWLAGWPPGPDVVELEGEPVPIGLPIIKAKSDTLYGETARYTVIHRETGPGAGMAWISTSATFGAQYNSRSGSFAYIRFGIGLNEPTTLEFILRRTGDAGSANVPLNGPYPAGPPSNLLVDLSAGTANGGPPAHISLVWGPAGHLPGQSWLDRFNYFIRRSVQDGRPEYDEGRKTQIDGVRAEIIPSVSSQSETAFALVTVPVSGRYGHEDPLWIGNPTSGTVASASGLALAEGSSILPSAIGYGFVTASPSDLNFAKLHLPDELPGGMASVDLLFGTSRVTVTPGEVFDFTQYSPLGVPAFSFTGIDPALGLDAFDAPAIAMGFEFVGDGISEFIAFTYSNALPGDFNFDGAVDAADYVEWRKGLGTTYAQSDYDTWRTNFGKSLDSDSGIDRIASVPEPASIVLFWMGALAVLFCRHSEEQ